MRREGDRVSTLGADRQAYPQGPPVPDTKAKRRVREGGRSISGPVILRELWRTVPQNRFAVRLTGWTPAAIFGRLESFSMRC